MFGSIAGSIERLRSIRFYQFIIYLEMDSCSILNKIDICGKNIQYKVELLIEIVEDITWNI